MVSEIFVRDPVSRLEGEQLLSSRFEHLVVLKDATTVCLGHLLDDTDNSGCHLACRHVDLLHQRGLLNHLIVSNWEVIIETGVNWRCLVILDPLSFRQAFNRNNIGIEGTILVL